MSPFSCGLTTLGTKEASREPNGKSQGREKWRFQMAVGQNLRHLFGDGDHPKVVFFKGFLGCSPEYLGFDPLPNQRFVEVSCFCR